MRSDHVNRLLGRVEEALAGPVDTEADLAAAQSILDATALELDKPERELAEAMRDASNELEMARFTVSREAWPAALETSLAPLKQLLAAHSSA